MPKVMSLYLDDSGTRNPDEKRPAQFMYRDWFTLGGYIIREEEEGILRTAHANFCTDWKINYPLHSYDIRAEHQNFRWLGLLDDAEYNKFMKQLSALLLNIPITGIACVVDRPGYNARYREKFGRQTWKLCQTAFSVVVERAAKFAIKNGCKLRVYVEEGDKTADDYIRSYYSALKKTGMPFASDSSAKYAPLSADQLRNALYDLDFKAKSSPMVQIADLYAYPIARGGYDEKYGPYADLRECRKLIDDYLSAEEISHLGIKYSCFELASEHKNKKGRK